MSDIEGSPRHRSRSAEGRHESRTVKYSRSRSRSRSRERGERRNYTRSRSRSHSRGRGRNSRSRSRSYGYRRRSNKYSRSRTRSRSRSPLSRRRRHIGSRDHPKTSRCLGVFGLSLYTTERDLRDYFGRYGPLDDLNLVHDHQTGRSRGFAFLYMRNLEDAVEAKERAPGSEIDGHKIRVDYSITERAHTPTPGVYLGRPTSRSSYRSERYSRRSPSPYYSRRSSRYSRSRSRERSYDRYDRGSDRGYDRYRY